jgi:hypothetical protein
MTGAIPLERIEAIIDASGIAPRIEALLPAGVRHRQLSVRALLAGMMLALDDRRPAYLTEARAALTSLPAADQARLGVTENWENGPHQLTYRQAEHTFGLVRGALEKQAPDGAPPGLLTGICEDLLEASIPGQHKDASRSLAADWTDVESHSRPPPSGGGGCADPEASWGHRTANLPGPDGELFFGYYLSALTMIADENRPPIPELARPMIVSSCHLDPARALAPVITRMPAAGVPLGDITDDSGYAHRDPGAWAIPLRLAGAELVQDLHPSDRGPKGTHMAPSSPTATSTAPPRRARCSNSARSRPAPRPQTPPPTTRKPPSSPATSCSASPPTTPTATTASPAPPPWANSAAPSARHR